MWGLFNTKISCLVLLVGQICHRREKVRTQSSELRVESGKLLPTYRWMVGSEETRSGSVPQ